VLYSLPRNEHVLLNVNKKYYTQWREAFEGKTLNFNTGLQIRVKGCQVQRLIFAEELQEHKEN
jgi:hypothetical protein